MRCRSKSAISQLGTPHHAVNGRRALRRGAFAHAALLPRLPAHLLRPDDAVAGSLDGEGEGQQEGPAAHKRAWGGRGAGGRCVGAAWLTATMAAALGQPLKASSHPSSTQEGDDEAHHGANDCLVLSRYTTTPIKSHHPHHTHTTPKSHPPRMAVTRPTGPATAAFLVSSAMWAEES